MKYMIQIEGAKDLFLIHVIQKKGKSFHNLYDLENREEILSSFV
jgi:hypothetical protein